MSEVQTRFSRPWSKRRWTRSGIVCGRCPAAEAAEAAVVTGCHGRGLIPRRPPARISFAIVLTETTSPLSRRSAVIRGAPFTPSDALCAALIFPVSPARRATLSPGPARRRPPTRSTPTGTPPAGRPCESPRRWPSPTRSTRTPRRVRILRREEGRGLFQELPIHPQLGDLPAQPFQLGAIVDVQRRRRINHPSPFLRHPPTQQLLPNADLASHRRDRATAVDHQPGSVTPVGLGVALPLRTHQGILPDQVHDLAGQDVHQTGSTPASSPSPGRMAGGPAWTGTAPTSLGSLDSTTGPPSRMRNLDLLRR